MGTLREEFAVQLDHIIEGVAERQKYPIEQETAVRVRKTPRISREESFARLDELLEEARAGAPDEWLSKQAHVAPDAVLAWRKLRKVARTRGRGGGRERSLWAVNLLGGFKSPLHPVHSPFSGLWEAPEYVLRRPLVYRELCRLVYSLHTTLGVGPELICEAMGLREKDVELALTVWANHLARSGEPCTTCGSLTDPRYGKFCSVRCASEGT